MPPVKGTFVNATNDPKTEKREQTIPPRRKEVLPVAVVKSWIPQRKKTAAATRMIHSSWFGSDFVIVENTTINTEAPMQIRPAGRCCVRLFIVRSPRLTNRIPLRSLPGELCQGRRTSFVLPVFRWPVSKWNQNPGRDGFSFHVR